jgi:predicted nucleic-acid-binding Zn-ribbon protein
MEQHLGRELTDSETVDHIDGDFSNDNIENLQVLSRIENIKKYMDNNHAKYIILQCINCNKSFERREAVEKYNREIRLSDGPFCSSECVGKVYH